MTLASILFTHAFSRRWLAVRSRDPLTPTTCKTWGPLRLAVPPLPQGGEGRVHSRLLLSPESSVNLNPLPSPPWGRGWTAAGAFPRGGGRGEGVTWQQIENKFPETH